MSDTSEPPREAPDSKPEQAQTDRLTLLQLIGSTLAAAVGVQSSANRQRDFTHGKAVHFIFMGILFTVVFVLTVLGVVNWVLP